MDKFWQVDEFPHMTRGERRQAIRLAALHTGRSVCFFDKGNSAPAPDPAIGQAAAANAETGKEMAGVAREQLAWNKQQYADVQPYLKKILDAQVTQSDTNTARSLDQWQQYKDIFQPVENKMASDAMNYDSPDKTEQRAAGDAAQVASSHDAAAASTEREMQRMGVNPADPRYAAVKTAAGLTRAGDMAGAMNTSRRNSELTGMSMRQATAQFGRNMPQTSIAQDQAALAAGGAAQGNIAGQSALYNNGVNAASPWYNGAVGANSSAGNLALGQFGAQLQSWDSSNKANASAMAGLGQAAGYFLGGNGAQKFIFGAKDGGIVPRMAGLERRVAFADGGVASVRVNDISIDPTDGTEMGGDDAYCMGGLARKGYADGTARVGVSTADLRAGTEVWDKADRAARGAQNTAAPASSGGPRYRFDNANQARQPDEQVIKGNATKFGGGMANGGLARIRYYDDGSMVRGPGTSTSDSIPAQLSDGEAVLNAEAVELVGEDFINRLNEAGLQRRQAEGGAQTYEGEYEREVA